MVERIIKLMEEKGINGAELAKMIGLSHGVVSEWKKGKAKPGTEAIIKIANYFGVTTDYLLTGKTNNSRPTIINLVENPKEDIAMENQDMYEMAQKIAAMHEMAQKMYDMPQKIAAMHEMAQKIAALTSSPQLSKTLEIQAKYAEILEQYGMVNYTKIYQIAQIAQGTQIIQETEGINRGVGRHKRDETRIAIYKKAVAELGLTDSDEDMSYEVIDVVLDFYEDYVSAEEGLALMQVKAAKLEEENAQPKNEPQKAKQDEKDAKIASLEEKVASLESRLQKSEQGAIETKDGNTSEDGNLV